MKEFLHMLRLYAWPYKGFMLGALFFNLLSLLFFRFQFVDMLCQFSQLIVGLESHV